MATNDAHLLTKTIERMEEVLAMFPQHTSSCLYEHGRGTSICAACLTRLTCAQLKRERDRQEESLMFRASGECICSSCGKTYKEHPFSRHRSHDGEPFLHLLCDGRLAKL